MALNRFSAQFLIGDQFVPGAVESERRMIYTVPESADDRADEPVFLFETVNVSETDDYVSVVAVSVRHHDADNACTIIKKLQ